MKRFCCLASVLLLGGCASYYRVVNGIAGEGEAWRKVGKAIFFGVINGTLHERSHGKVGWPWISGRIVTHHIPGGIWMKKAPWSRYEEIAIYLRCRDSRFEERLNSNGGRLFVYEYNGM